RPHSSTLFPYTTLFRSEPAARDALHFAQRGSKPRQVGLGEGRKKLHQYEMRDVLDVACARGWKARERRRLVVTCEPGFSPRHREDRKSTRLNSSHVSIS